MSQNSWMRSEQARRNEASRLDWDRYQLHRERVTNLILESVDQQPTRPPGSLCILGAGNCNDVDLAALTARFHRIDLVDLDGAALTAAVDQARQREPLSCQIQLHQGFDVTGVYDQIAIWREERPTSTQIDAVKATLSKLHLPTEARFDVVVSVGLVSQLIDTLTRHLREDHPEFIPLLQAVRQQHLLLLAALIRPGGHGVLLVDFVSTDTAPHLANVEARDLSAALNQLLADRNFFHGLNPFRILQLFRTAPLDSLTYDAQCVEPWRWDFGPRVYAVTAIRFRRAPR